MKKRHNTIMYKIVNYIHDEYNIKYSNIKFGNGYFIFELGEDSVCHFKVEGIKRWKFGIWVVKDEKIKGDYQISLFGENEDYIDKFKPTQTKISYTFRYKKNEDFNKFIEIFNFTEDIKAIKLTPILRRYFYYSYSQKLLKFILSDFWFYRLEFPIKNWFEKYFCFWYLKFIGIIYKIIFKRKNINFDVKVIRRENIFPSLEFKVIYGENNEDVVENIYFKLQKIKRTKHFQYWKYLLIPRVISKNISFINAQNLKDERGFYFK